MSYRDALDAVTRGEPICLFDFHDREAETDVLYLGRTVEAAEIDFIRRVVGGPLALYVSAAFCERLELGTFVEIARQGSPPETLRRLVTQNRGHDPRFSLSIDFRENKTGCSPLESARTASRLCSLVTDAAELSDDELRSRFVGEFVSPGHVPVIKIAAGLHERTGHAELSGAMAERAGVPVFIVAGELVDPETLQSMTYERAQAFAREHGLPFTTGDEILEHSDEPVPA